MQNMLMNILNLKQSDLKIEQALLSDEHTLVSFGQDFGKIFKSNPAAVFKPMSLDVLQIFIQYAANHHLPVTIRGKGLSQGGQSLAIDGGITLSMEYFNQCHEIENNSIWVEVNASWADVLDKTLPHQLAPYALPYNCNLSVGGVLSAGGIGAASFKQSLISSHIKALEVVDGKGEVHLAKPGSSLFEACLGGQGRCAVITRACVDLKPVASEVQTFYLVYDDMELWLKDVEIARQSADYLELFCSPCIQGAGMFGDVRKPMAQWLYGLHVSFEVNGDEVPDISDLSPWKLLHQQKESISSYFLRHNGRFEMMKMAGLWEQVHPWYECFIPATVLKENLNDILADLPLHYANLVHVVPIAKKQVGMTMFPESESFYELMILNPGVTEAFKDGCIETIKSLDERLLSKGGKRYLSGYLGDNLDAAYWQKHFGGHYQHWLEAKKQFDPQGIFTSHLFQSSS